MGLLSHCSLAKHSVLCLFLHYRPQLVFHRKFLCWVQPSNFLYLPLDLAWACSWCWCSKAGKLMPVFMDFHERRSSSWFPLQVSLTLRIWSFHCLCWTKSQESMFFCTISGPIPSSPCHKYSRFLSSVHFLDCALCVLWGWCCRWRFRGKYRGKIERGRHSDLWVLFRKDWSRRNKGCRSWPMWQVCPCGLWEAGVRRCLAKFFTLVYNYTETLVKNT